MRHWISSLTEEEAFLALMYFFLGTVTVGVGLALYLFFRN